ncbi:hypothetical protein [Streptomyces sp. NPDC059979]|uniref:hypothetical protein n=1 Tax=Streptomyces sp. NPDC059979 TaxID=3347021 RepID=UPI0036836D40
MNVIRTTPLRPVDVTALFPQLASMALPAIRLHPRPVSPTRHDSSVGDPLVWPAHEPWPHCDESHDQAGQLYDPDYKPPTALFWRSSAEVTDVLAAPPGPFVVEYDGYIPRPCVLAPEQITEYPNSLDLSKELQARLGDWSRWQTAGSCVDSRWAPYPESFYGSHPSLAPGWLKSVFLPRLFEKSSGRGRRDAVGQAASAGLAVLVQGGARSKSETAAPVLFVG